MTRSNKIWEEDFVELYDNLQKQLVEDRDIIVALYNDLKGKITTKEDFSINGANIAKIAELLLRSTAQLSEIIKFSKTAYQKSENLSEEDITSVYKEIQSDKH